MSAIDKEAAVTHARLVIAAEAARTVLAHLDRKDMYLSKEAVRDLERLAKEAPTPPRPMYTLDSGQ